MNTAIGAACFLVNKPRSMEYVDIEPPVDSPLVSKNGKRLPLRAIPYRELNRRFWSRGEVVYADALERNMARELAAHKPVEEMTLEELEATQDREPLTESRLSFLTTGVGVLHLDATDDETESEDGDEIGSLAEAIPQETRDKMYLVATNGSVVNEDDIPEAELDNLLDRLNDRRYGTAYDLLDPITAKQIDWEQEKWHESETRTIRISDGTLSVDKSFPTKDQFLEVARRVKRYLLPDPGSDAPLERRITRLTKEQVGVLTARFSRFIENEIDRATTLDDELAHGSFEDLAGLIHLHSPRGLALDERRFGPYHGTPMDRSEVAIFNTDGSDEDIDALIGRPECPTAGCFEYLVMPNEDEGQTFSPFCDNCGIYLEFGQWVNGFGRFTRFGYRAA